MTTALGRVSAGPTRRGSATPWADRLLATPLGRAFAVTIVWRVVAAVWGVLAHGIVRGGPYKSYTLMHAGWTSNVFTSLIDAGVRMDAWWYAGIAQHGYTYSTRRLSSIAYNPLYPILIKAVSVVTGNVFVSGMLISTVCLFAAVWLFYLWLEDHGMARVSPMAVALMLCYPFAFFWVSMYTESLFLVLLLGTYVAFERGKWTLAALCAFLAVLTRFTGLLITPTLLALLLTGDLVSGRRLNRSAGTRGTAWIGRTLSESWRQLGAAGLGPLVAIAAGPVAYVAFASYQWAAFGTPLASVRAEMVTPFSRDFSEAVSDLMLRRPGFPPWFLLFMLAFGLLFMAAAPLVYRRFGPAYALFSVLAVLLPMSTGLVSLERYVMIDFPVFAAVASVKWKVVPVALAVAGFYGLLLFMALFVGGYTII